MDDIMMTIANHTACGTIGKKATEAKSEKERKSHDPKKNKQSDCSPHN